MHNRLSEFVLHKIAMLDKKDDSYSKAACAKLRRAVGKSPEESPDVWEITLQGAPKQKNISDIIHVTLTLYALHKQGKDESMNDDKTGFGTAVKKMIDNENEDAIRRRFNSVITATEFTELAYHARGLIQLFRAKNIKMNYARFADDLYFFQNPEYSNKVRLRWGEEFYNTKEGKEEQ
jgi:CRISPR system Cascade subunit CasB